MSRSLRIGLSAVLALGLLAVVVLWGELSPQRIVDALCAIGLSTWTLSLLVQGALYLLRAERLKVLLPHPIPARQTLSAISAAHTMWAYFLPARLGEASLPLFLKNHAAASASEGAATLLLVRVLDLLCLALAMSATCLTLAASGTMAEVTWLLPTGLLLLLPALLLLLLLAMRAAPIRCLRRLLPKAPLAGLEQALLSVSPRALLRAAFWTLPLWIGVFAFWGILALGPGTLELSLIQATFAASLVVLSTLLPFNLFGGLGFQDLGFAFGLTLMGAPPGPAAEVAVATHLVYALNLALFGFLGQGFLAMRKKE